MSRLTKTQAVNLAADYRIPLGEDFHALASEHVQRILDASYAVNYRQHRNANGSRARSFYAYLKRAAS